MMKTYLKIWLFLCASLVHSSVQASAAIPEIKERNILGREAAAINFSESLITDKSWNRLPDYNSREFWERIPSNMKVAYISKAEEYLNYDWPVVKATDYLEFIRSGDRRQQVYAEPGRALNSLVLGELIEGKGRFIDQIINAVWYYSEQTWWGWSAHLYFQKAPGGLPDINEPTVDLGVGEIACDLSWTWYLFRDEFDKVHPLISQRLKQAIVTKAVNPYFERSDFGYMGFTGGRVNNWNPWVNYNMLNCFMILEDDPARKVAMVTKIINSLDKFLNGYPDDGGCDEGPSYWGVAGSILYESLALLKDATAGKFDVFDNPLIIKIGTYFPRVNIHAPYFINFADADATTGGNPATVYLYGKSINDRMMQKFGAYLARLNKWGENPFSGKICDQIENLVLLPEITKAEAEEALVPDFWLPETEIAGGRDREGSYEGFFFGAKGGFNAESHNHNDVGSCIMYFNGKPCLIDLGRETYTAKTFGPQRYEIWTMQSAYHNLPVINGVEQKEGAAFKAKNSSFSASSKSVSFSADIAGAYLPAANIKSWVRTYTLNIGKNFIISDKYELSSITSAPTSSNLITSCRVSEGKPGELIFNGDGFTLRMSYDPKKISPEVEFIEVTDSGLKRYWPEGVTRVVLRFINTKTTGSQSVTFSKM
ncbi:MAG TPA: heparinase II/III family protein [Bacteroidales bacterium]|nr:heparinase II/III family protein [Bacteroidales bacterium]